VNDGVHRARTLMREDDKAPFSAILRTNLRPAAKTAALTSPGGGMSHVFHTCTSAAALAALFVGGAAAQTYPVKPIRIVVGYATGGAVDFSARLLAQKLPELLRQTVIVENRPGAGSTIGTERVATAPPDGYTLLLMPTTAVVQSALRSNLTYNLERDLQPVSLMASGPFVLLVHPSVPARTVKELIALARSRPGQLNCASPGVGSANHLAQALLNTMANVNIAHVPYKGGNEAAVATASGQVDMSLPSVAGALPLLRAKRVRALGVSGLKRTPLLPELATLDEAGIAGYDYTAWYGVVAPAAVPKEIIARLNAAIAQIVSAPDVKEVFARQGMEARASTPAEFGAVIKADLAKNAKLVKLTNIQAE
jgi:tripartite-type tricarboxylate transporter receptor subunit TctC